MAFIEPHSNRVATLEGQHAPNLALPFADPSRRTLRRIGSWAESGL